MRRPAAASFATCERIGDLEPHAARLALRPHGHRWPIAAHRWAREICVVRPDLIEVGDAGPEAWATLWAARALDVPLVAFCHSDIVQMAERRAGPVAGAATRIYARAFYRRCDVVIAPSEFMRERLVQWGVPDAVAASALPLRR